MDRITLNALQGAAGAGGAEVNVEEVFSTYLYTGSVSPISIDNGIDLDGEGGMVWIKRRNIGFDHYVFDTERGENLPIYANGATAETAYQANNGINSFDDDGFTLGNASSGTNSANPGYCSWTFRKAPKFFDVQTYTGNGTGQAIDHDLASKPGMIICKRLDSTSVWTVYHSSLSNIKSYLTLNGNAAVAEGAGGATWPWYGVVPTTTQFSVAFGSNGNSDYENNINNAEYVAYLFAEDEAIIKCGTYEGTAALHTIDTGFAVQWVLVRKIDEGADWVLVDTERGDYTQIYPNESQIEQVKTAGIKVSPSVASGFSVDGGTGDTNADGKDYLYVAIAAE